MEDLIANPLTYAVLLGAGGTLVSIGVWVGNVNADRKSFKEFMKEIGNDIRKILDRLGPPKTLEHDSPLTLSDIGKKISRRIDAKQWAGATAKTLIDRIPGKEDFEIEQIAFDYINEEFEPENDLGRQILRAAYETGSSRWDVHAVLAVELRDVLIKYRDEPPAEPNQGAIAGYGQVGAA